MCIWTDWTYAESEIASIVKTVVGDKKQAIGTKLFDYCQGCRMVAPMNGHVSSTVMVMDLLPDSAC